MSHIIPISAINQFLPVYKWELDESIDPETGYPVDHHKVDDLEVTARGIVLGRLRSVYDAEGWLPVGGQPSATPELVVSVMGMLVAGWAYDRQFAEEDTEGGSYGARRVREAYSLLSGIIDGTYDIGEELVSDPHDEPTTLETEPYFTMNMVT